MAKLKIEDREREKERPLKMINNGYGTMISLVEKVDGSDIR